MTSFDQADTPAAVPHDVHVAEIQAAKASAIAEFLAWLRPAPDAEPADESLILVDEEVGYIRADEYPGQPERPGDWWALTGVSTGPYTLTEILDLGSRATDDPPRVPHSYEPMFTMGDIDRAAGQWVTQQLDAGTDFNAVLADLYARAGARGSAEQSGPPC